MTRWSVLAAAWVLVGASLPMTVNAGLFGNFPGWVLLLSPILLPANFCLLCSPGLVALGQRRPGRWLARVLSLSMLEPAALVAYSLAVDGTTDLPPALILFAAGQLIACVAVWLPSGTRRPSTAPGGFPVVESRRTRSDASN